MLLQDFIKLLNTHTKYRKKALNLIASENCSSPLVRAALASDLGNRYTADFYGGTKFLRKIIAQTESIIRELFNADYAIITPISGNLCDLAILLGFTKNKQKVMVIDAENDGGYPLDYSFFDRKKIALPFNNQKMDVSVEKAITAIKKHRPTLIIFGASFIPFPESIKEISEAFSHRKTLHIAYDASHVLGLIAGKQFQDPLREGAHVMIGSTHKTFPGPQGGIVLTNDMKRYELLSSVLDLDLDEGIRLMDNNHPNHIAALGIAALEMLKFGKKYAKQIVINSQILAERLHSAGVPVRFKKQGFTKSHQVLLETPNYDVGAEFKDKAEKVGLIVDSGGRLGTAEVTRLGMKELEMKELAELIAQVYFDDITAETERRIRTLAQLFSKPSYCFENYEQILTL